MQKIILKYFVGFFSLWMRQTNIIWVAFTAALYGYQLLTEALEKEQLKIKKDVNHFKKRLY